MNLNDIRQDINDIDTAIVELLEARMDLVSQVATFKKMTGTAVLDNNREIEIMNRVGDLVVNKDYKVTIVNQFKDILKHSRNYQAEQLGRN